MSETGKSSAVHPENVHTGFSLLATDEVLLVDLAPQAVGLPASLRGPVARTAWSEESPTLQAGNISDVSERAPVPPSYTGVKAFDGSFLQSANGTITSPTAARTLNEHAPLPSAPLASEVIGISIHGFMGSADSKKMQSAVLAGHEEGSLIVEESESFMIGCSRKEHIPPGTLRSLEGLKSGMELLQGEMPWLSPTFYIHFTSVEERGNMAPKILLKMHDMSSEALELVRFSGPSEMGALLMFGRCPSKQNVVMEVAASFVKFTLDHIGQTAIYDLMRDRPHLKLFEVMAHKFTKMDKEDTEARLLFYILELSEQFKIATGQSLEVSPSEHLLPLKWYSSEGAGIILKYM
ncbi:hypothetical protein CYMTET_34087 [Cymbomonas tetramitiformis]|uniref:Uncharacterized protein n=1 Tax=Cymbomonas tetramitiformis TaxID=36881 RepID=A0AAE0KQA8_9CHLO|nr:hypothetical protein CYMTET_34087 [Cymbomonas tetramitiformis]